MVKVSGMLPDKPWKLEGIICWMLGMFVCLSVISLLQAGVQHLLHQSTLDEGSTLNLIFNSLKLHGSILFSTIFFLHWHKTTWKEAFGLANPSVGKAMLLGMVVIILFIPAGILLQNLSVMALTYYHKPISAQAAVEELGKLHSWAGWAYFIVFAVLIAPLAEEIFFRGILYTALKQTGYPRFALWASALAFAAIHDSAPIFVPLLLLGLIFAWLYERTSNLLSSITAHSVFNAVNIFFYVFTKHFDQAPHKVLHALR